MLLRFTKSCERTSIRLLLGWSLSVAGLAVGAEPSSPNTSLSDTGTSSPEPWTAEALAARKGWTQLAEDDLTHKFRGDVVLTNDRLSMVLRANGSGAEVYARAGAGLKRRALLAPVLATGNSPAKLTSVVITENNPGAVMVEAAFRSGEAIASLKYRLTAGQGTVEVRPGAETTKVLVQAEVRYLVVPDFFGDDMVFAAESLAGGRLGLPSENYLLGMLDAGNAMLMCVWPSGSQRAEAFASHASGSQQTQRPAIGGCEIGCPKDKGVWIAFLESPGLWHEQSIAADAPGAVNLDWKPPFSAKWRADFLRTSGFAESRYFTGGADAEDASGQAPEQCPCRLDGGRALVRAPATPNQAPARSGRQPVLVYPIDRDRSTPLDTFSPMDILRNTLGVGPCQYILQKEGLATETNPTPDAVMTFVETQFKKKKEKKAADEIRDLLGQMVDHVKRAQAKIQRYRQFAQQARDLLKTGQAGADSTLAKRLLPIVQDMERIVAIDPAAPPAPERAAKLSDEVAGLIGKSGALAECQRLAGQVRGLGAAEDRTLSNCRMAVRWLNEQCRAAAAQDAAAAALARRIESEAERVLSK